MRDGLRRSWHAVPEWLKLALVVLAGAALCAQAMRGLVSWIVQTDELQYVRLAMSAGRDLTLVPGLHGEPFGGLSKLYPLMIAPAYGLFDTPTAFKAAHVLNAIAFASAAIPAYLLSRAVVASRVAAHAVAALSIVVPWAGMTLILWTESLAYPVFLWTVLAIQRALTAAGPGRDAIALAALAAAFLTRTQFLVLAVAFPVAIVLHEGGYALARRHGGSALSELRRALAGAAARHVLVAGAVVLAAVLAATGALGELLGPYRGTVGQDPLFPPGWGEVVLMHVSIVGVAIGIVPMVLALAWAPLAAVRPPSKGAHAFAVLAAVVGGVLFLQASAFVVRYSMSTPNDRYFFYVVPLLLVAAAAFLLQGPRHWAPALAAAAAFAWTVDKASFRWDLYQSSPASAFNPTLNGATEGLRDLLALDGLSTPGAIRWGVLLAGAAIAAAVHFVPPPRLAATLAVALLVFGVGETHEVLGKVRATQVQRGLPGRDWVDRAATPDAAVGMAPSPIVAGVEVFEGRELWWDAEFWNRSIKRVYSYREVPHHTPFPAIPLEVNRRSGRLTGAELPRLLVLAHNRPDLGVRGRHVADNGVLRLVDLGPSPRASWTLQGLTPALRGVRPRGRALLRVYPREPGRGPARLGVTVRLAAPRGLRRAQSFRIRVGGAVLTGRVGRRVREGRAQASPAVERRLSVCAGPGAAPIDISSGAAAAAVPLAAARRVERIGLMVVGVRVDPLRGSCGG